MSHGRVRQLEPFTTSLGIPGPETRWYRVPWNVPLEAMEPVASAITSDARTTVRRMGSPTLRPSTQGGKDVRDQLHVG